MVPNDNVRDPLTLYSCEKVGILDVMGSKEELILLKQKFIRVCKVLKSMHSVYI